MKHLFVANRGEIALRIIRTAHRIGLTTTLAAHAVDLKSVASQAASQTAQIFGDPPVAAYLDIPQLIQTALDRGCDAVHPGYGFLSENEAFAAQVEAAGLCWVGPSPSLIDLMGDKIRAREFAHRCGLPLVPFALDSSDEEFREAVLALGLPVLIKAAAGGGGKGIKIVRREADLAGAIARARSEALRYFGDDRIYAERYVERPRHIEVQILADGFGKTLHLGERECSIQRRFQKIIEEAPSVAVDRDLRSKICGAAVSLAKAAKYRNAGTVEFILGPEREFYFLEMNTRLQVEHPVTEFVTGLDLVEWQLRIASGEALPFEQSDIASNGHAIECRINAEDVRSGFVPSSGTIARYIEPEGEGVRVDSGVRELDQLTSAFDPMLAKLIVWGPDRASANMRAEVALRNFCLLGPETNIAYLRALLKQPEYISGHIDTGFIDLHQEEVIQRMQAESLLDVEVAAAFVALTLPEALVPYSRLAELGAWKN
ncbi:MAG: biotin carboxylase N-terminal domain-containing protein [Pseudomonadota bacterium]